VVNYCGVEQGKRFARLVNYKDLGFTTVDEYEDYVEDMIKNVSRFIDSFCKRPDDFFNGGATITEYHNGRPRRSSDFPDLYADQKASRELRRTFYLEHYPILAVPVPVVKENVASIGSADDWKTRATTDYRLDTRNGLLKFSLAQTPDEGFKNVEVVYKAGFATTPAVVSWVCAEIIGNFLQAAVGDRSSQWIQMARPTPFDFATPAIFTKEMERRLKPYVKRR